MNVGTKLHFILTKICCCCLFVILLENAQQTLCGLLSGSPWKERDKYVERHRATRRTDRERKRVPERGNVKVRREVCSWSLHKVVKLNYVTKLSRRVGKKYPQSCLVALVFFTKLYRKLACPQFLLEISRTDRWKVP